ncbi:hypothetical protein [Bradyrhizobium ottawaense]|uniref:hypothetical protein n=1 Tax=Bradyrhizobium ottawaense TaxID=931866 RepID=UPI000675FC3A|nr:hypothetical protein [Bradyrhizobium ottawaense]
MTSKSNGPQEEYAKVPLDKLNVFKFWRIQNPNADKLLREIIFRWRGASAYVRGKPGKWVVWPRERWCEWTGLSRNQLDRALKELVDSSLINRERHRFAGSEVRTFVRPTQTSLKHLGRPQDIAQLAAAAQTEGFAEKLTEKPAEKSVEKTGEKISEETDYTSIPSSSIKSTITPSPAEATGLSSDPEGEGKVGEDEIDITYAKLQEVKTEKDKKLFPEKLGPHQKDVKHPSILFPKWASFSHELKVKFYSRYLEYVDNWKNGKKGKAMINSIEIKPTYEWTEEDQASLDSWVPEIKGSQVKAIGPNN